MKAYRGSSSTAPLFRNLDTKRKWAVNSKVDRFAPGERPRITSRIGGWVCPRSGLDILEKRESACPCRDSNPASFSLSLHRLLYLWSALFLFFYCNSVYYYLNYINYTVYVILPRAYQQSKIVILSDSRFMNGFQKYKNETNKIEPTRETQISEKGRPCHLCSSPEFKWTNIHYKKHRAQ